MRSYYVYLLASRKNGTLYLGVTSDLVRRVYEHKNNFIKGYTEKYCVHRLVWFERHATAEEARIRERRIKRWKRAWKISLIEKENPAWQELYDQIA